VSDIEQLRNEVSHIKDDLGDCKEAIARIEGKLEVLVGKSDSMKMLLQYVVTPLLVILGALIGVKIVLPSV
jgi:hypothetical protein